MTNPIKTILKNHISSLQRHLDILDMQMGPSGEGAYDKERYEELSNLLNAVESNLQSHEAMMARHRKKD